MSWFDAAGFANLAKSALTTAQKTIDKALDIQDEAKNLQSVKNDEEDNFFEAYGLSNKPATVSTNESKENKHSTDEKHSKASTSIWGTSSTWGSFFEIKGQSSAEENKPFEKSKHSETPKKQSTILSQPPKSAVFTQPVKKESIQLQKTFVEEIPKTEQEFRTSDEPVLDPKSKNEGLVHHKDCTTVSEGAIDPEFDVSDISIVSQPQKAPDIINESICVADSTSLNQEEQSVQSHTENLESESPKIQLANEPDPVLTIVTEQPCKESNFTIADKSLNDNVTPTIVTEQPCKDTVFPSSDSVDCSESVTDSCDNVPKIQSISTCDIPIQPNTNEICDVPTSELPPFSKTADECLDQSMFFHLELPESNQTLKPESQPVIDQANIKMDVSSGSFTHLVCQDAARSVDSESDSSTLIIPDFPIDVTENVTNWECSAEENLHADDDNSSWDESTNVPVKSLNMPIQHPSTDSNSNNNQTDLCPSKPGTYLKTWPQPTKSMDESQLEEHNSHHSSGSSNSSKDDDDTDTAEVKDYDTKSTCSSGATSSSSFVKCSAVEAELIHRAQSPASDATKQDTSGDENETATSSDIEILSPPNGDNGTSPLKHIWMTRPIRSRRSESPTSDSSKDSVMPVLSELDEGSYEDENHSPTALYDEKEDSQTRKELGDNNVEDILKKQDELQTILEAREKKILELSKENMELQENEQRLKNLMHKMRIEQDKEAQDIAALTREFSQKLSSVEEKLKNTTKERNILQNQLEVTKSKVIDRLSSAEMDDILKEKDKEIKELIEEGQKLSKKELTHTTIIKKLRLKEKEMEKTAKAQSERIDENNKEVERLRRSIEAKEEQEKKHIDAIRNLTNTVKKFEKEVGSLKSDLEDSLEKEHSVRRSLDSTYKDYTELQKSFAAKEKEVEELKSHLESEAHAHLIQSLESASREASREKESLILQMQELRGTICRTQEEANMREKMFKAEVASLQKRLQDAEERNEDLTKNMSSATRPLVRQIENLQATFTSQTISWEKIEKNLTDRLSDAQNQIALLSERERCVQEKFSECQAKLAAMESQNGTLRQEKVQLATEMEAIKAKMIVFDENKNRESYTIEKIKQNMNTEINKLKQEKMNLENTMATCLEQLDAERRKTGKLEEEIKIKDARAALLVGSSPCPSPTGSVRSSVSSLHNWSHDEGHEAGGLMTPVNSYRMSVYDSLRLGGSGSSLIENLQSQLKQREGEILQLQSEIVKLEQVKESMSRELVILSEQNDSLDKRLSSLENIDKEFKVLDQKYNTLLQMYGEKVEETEELHLDLADVKSMYKAQIEELLRKK